jgi:hypothetical protein
MPSPTRSVLALLAVTAATTTAASAAELGADARPPPFFPQRADNLILRGVEAGGPASLAALDGVPCTGNACVPAQGVRAVRGELLHWMGSAVRVGGGARSVVHARTAAVGRRRPVQCGGAARTVAAVMTPWSPTGR